MTESVQMSSIVPDGSSVPYGYLAHYKAGRSKDIPGRNKWHFGRNSLPLRGSPRASCTLVSGSAGPGNLQLQLYQKRVNDRFA